MRLREEVLKLLRPAPPFLLDRSDFANVWAAPLFRWYAALSCVL